MDKTRFKDRKSTKGREKIFCYWHIKTVENQDGTDCSAHLADGRCFKCPYESVEARSNTEYPCTDYKEMSEE